MFTPLVIDFETRSKVDLKTCGADRYAMDMSTDILCLGMYDTATDESAIWFPSDGPLLIKWVQKILEADFIAAHNARFDRLIWEYIGVDDYGFPEIPEDKWYDTAAQCRVNALPASLDKAAQALELDVRKDHRGGQLIRLLSIPNKEGEFNEDPQALIEMGEYCLRDVETTVAVIRNTRPMTPREHEDWQVNERINDKGVRIDVELARLAESYAADEADEIAQELRVLTYGAVTKHTQTARMVDWLKTVLTEAEVDKFLVRYKDGKQKFSRDKSVRAALLAYARENDLNTPEWRDICGALEAFDNGNKSSVSKFKRMLGAASPRDERVRGAFIYAGAGQTKRASAQVVQLHNFVRDCFNPEDAEFIKDLMRRGQCLDDVMLTLSKLLRPALLPAKGHVFVVGDWSAIEGRVLPWLTKDRAAEDMLDIFRRGEDVYMHTAKGMGIDDRQIGKVSVLSLGFQGAVNAFAAMGRNYGLFLPEAQVKAIVEKWRTANPWAPRFWRKLEEAAMNAVKNPTKEYPVGRLAYTYLPNIAGGSLFCVLPDGSFIQYAKARLEEVQTPWGRKLGVTYIKTSIPAAADAKTWPRGALYGGILAENATQATAAILLRDAICELDDVIAHVHDEIIIEVPEHLAQNRLHTLRETMETVPDWAEGLPLDAEPTIMTRYGK